MPRGRVPRLPGLLRGISDKETRRKAVAVAGGTFYRRVAGIWLVQAILST